MVLSAVMILMSRVGMHPCIYQPPPVTWVEAWGGVRGLQFPWDILPARPPPKPPPSSSSTNGEGAACSSSPASPSSNAEGAPSDDSSVSSSASSVSNAEGDAANVSVSSSASLPALHGKEDDDSSASSVTSVDGEGDDDSIASNDALMHESVEVNQPKCMSQEDLDFLIYCQFISVSSLSTNDPLLSDWKDLSEHVTTDWSKTLMFCFLSPWSAHSFGPLGLLSDIDRAIYAVVDTGASMCVTFCKEDFIHY
jgi:hypothetical protein